MNDVRPLTRFDAIAALALAALTLAITLYFAPRGFHDGFVDMGHDGYQLRQALDLARGGVIFRNTFDQYGPLTGYLNTAGFLAFGQRLLAMKYFICAWYLAIVLVLFLIARHWLDRGAAAFALLVWLGLAPFYNHGIMISAHVYALLFQSIAIVLILRSPQMTAGTFIAAGVLAGLSWAVKQSLGVLFLASLAVYVVARVRVEGESWRRAIGPIAALLAGWTVVLIACLGFLWRRDALHDWYLQTVVFPREFYLARSGEVGEYGIFGAVWQLLAPFVAFARLQLEQPFYWIVIRLVVLLTAAAELYRRRLRHELLLMASVTAFLWLATYPSANFMHQWWTASLTIPVCVFCVRDYLSRWFATDRGLQLATIAVVGLGVSPGFAERATATVARARALTETLTYPTAFRGIRTDVRTKRAFELLTDRMEQFRAAHPRARVVSIETTDGWTTGMVETLPLLSFLDDNTHPRPVYWNLPVLSTTVYPHYRELLWRQVDRERPLIVDHRYGRFNPIRICGYQLMEAVVSDVGYWYMYEPADDQRDKSNIACDDDDTGRFEAPARLKPAGAYRGRVKVSADTIAAPSDADLRLVGSRTRVAAADVDLYTWPAGLVRGKLDARLDPLSTEIKWRVDRSIIKNFHGGSWAVDGPAPSRYSYLLQWPADQLDAGNLLVIRGELDEGGLQVGFLQDGAWVGYVAVTRPGPFEAVLEVQEPADYEVVVASYVTSTWQDRARAHPLAATLGLLVGGFFPNRFHVSEAGWIRPDGG